MSTLYIASCYNTSNTILVSLWFIVMAPVPVVSDPYGHPHPQDIRTPPHERMVVAVVPARRSSLLQPAGHRAGVVLERVAVKRSPATSNCVLFLFKKSGETRFLRVGSCGLYNGQESGCSACFCCFCFAVRCMHPSFLLALYYVVSFQFVTIF